MLHGLKIFHHLGDSDSSPVSTVDHPAERHALHAWSWHVWEERRLKRRDECLRGLAELEAELLHEVEREG